MRRWSPSCARGWKKPEACERMKREDVKELHYIAPIANVASIVQHGLLSHNQARKIPHCSVAMTEIQQRRTRKVVPGGRPLHDYVNLYFHARNPMLFTRREQHGELFVLRISAAVLDMPDVIITDGNAASDYTAFYPSPEGLLHLNSHEIFAEWWTDANPFVEWAKKRKKCAELLVPDMVNAEYIVGAYVSSDAARRAMVALGFQ